MISKHPATSDHVGNGELDSLFQYASRLMARVYHHHGHAPHAQRHIFQMIRERGPMPQKELMGLLGVRSASLSEVLAKLERQGLISRKRNETDKRGFIVAANEAQPSRQEPTKQMNRDFFACLDDEEQKQLASLLRKTIASVERNYPGHHGARIGKRHNRMFRGRKRSAKS
jgi:DNA-binding MarR family transcriptional regulator